MLFDPYAHDLATAARQPRLPGDTLTTSALLAVPTEARTLLWHGLTEAVAGALDLWEQTPPGHRGALPSFSVQHAGKPQFDPAALRSRRWPAGIDCWASSYGWR